MITNFLLLFAMSLCLVTFVAISVFVVIDAIKNPTKKITPDTSLNKVIEEELIKYQENGK